MHRLAQSVLNYIRKQELLHAGDRVGVAVSGGADSVALLQILLELRDEIGLVLSVVHFNHKLRDKESEADEQFVRELSDQYEAPFFAESGDAKAYATKTKLSLETAAKELRYAFFHRLLSAEKLNQIATAHTIDDQAETVLLKLARGAGTRGLAGIYPKISTPPSTASHQVGIVRPLLAISRTEVERYLHDVNRSWREDATNRDLLHARNRVRHQVLPSLLQALNPRTKEILAEVAEIARAEEEFWAEYVSSLLASYWKRSGDWSRLDATAMRGLPLAVQRRLVRKSAESVGLTLEFRHVEGVLALESQGAQAALPGGWIATFHEGQIEFRSQPKPLDDYRYPLSVPGRVRVQQAGMILEASDIDEHEAPAGEHILKADLAQLKLVVRNWRAGDRFWPSHMKGPKKIKELLQDRHVTGEQKKLWPVVASGDEVVWVRGFGIRRDCQAKKGESGVLIRELRFDDDQSEP